VKNPVEPSFRWVEQLWIRSWGDGATGFQILAFSCDCPVCVKVHGVPAHDQASDWVSNAMGMEGGQKVFVVLVHPAPTPSL